MVRDALLTTDTRIVLLFVCLGLTSWYLVRQVTTSSAAKLAALLGVGVLVPTLINEWRRRSAG
ncbi:hypothetical protein [Haloplanus pelagicus]|jgi:hypothetical protein|uniref:hypothetical protein n=1 Tax=Haloplanus pelagicus TaxID=2949995 RepID=UPI00204095BA|nr:hypothetical protein [Haloplanus sp. HW8-1]